MTLSEIDSEFKFSSGDVIIWNYHPETDDRYESMLRFSVIDIIIGRTQRLSQRGASRRNYRYDVLVLLRYEFAHKFIPFIHYESYSKYSWEYHFTSNQNRTKRITAV